jgi:hypothetical protein
MLSGARKWACAAIGPGPRRALSACKRIRAPDLTDPHAGPTIRGPVVDAAGYGAGAWSLLIMDAFGLTDDVRADLPFRVSTPSR